MLDISHCTRDGPARLLQMAVGDVCQNNAIGLVNMIIKFIGILYDSPNCFQLAHVWVMQFKVSLFRQWNPK